MATFLNSLHSNGKNYINSFDKLDGLTLTGNFDMAGLDPSRGLSVTINGMTVNAVASSWGADGSFSIQLPPSSLAALSDGASKAIVVSAWQVSGGVKSASLLATVDTQISAPTLALAADTGARSTDGITKNGQINVSKLESGASWSYSIDGGLTWQTGKGSSFKVPAGAYGTEAIQVKQTDAAGNQSAVSKFKALTIDTKVAALSVALAEDTGLSATDRITRSGAIKVGGLEADATWQYSTDGGKSWKAGAGDGFNVAQGIYKANVIQVRQTDSAGNVSTATKLTAFTVDQQAAAAPRVALAQDTGTASDFVTSNGTVNVTGLEAKSSWQYSTDYGQTWVQGHGSSFVLPAGTFDGNQVQVRQTDTAGNISTAAKLSALTVDTSIAAPTLSLSADTGSSATDHITANGQITVNGLEAGATWDYSTNGGATWTAGSGTSIAASAFQQGANHVIVRTRDAAGNVYSAAKENLQLLNANGGDLYHQLSLSAGSNGVRLADSHWMSGLVLPTQGSAIGQVYWVENAASTPTVVQTQGTNLGAALTLGRWGGSAAFQWDGSQWLYQGDTPPSFDFILDTSLAAPTLSLSADTGSSATDGITANGQITVNGLEAGATWDYSTNGGATWTAGSGSSFTLPAGAYAAEAVQVRQTDTAGNVSTAAKLSAVTVDTSLSAPTLSLSADTGISATDGITSNGQITVNGLEAGATWDYSTDGGASWTAGTGSTIAASAFQQGANHVIVRTRDLAGNVYSPGRDYLTYATQTYQHDFAVPQLPGVNGTIFDYWNWHPGVVLPTQGSAIGQVYWVVTESNWWDTFVQTQGTDLSAPLSLFNSGRAASFLWDGSRWLYQGNTVKTFDFTLDSTIATPTLALAADTGSSATDRITADGQITVNGLEAGATWDYSTDGGATWTAGTGSTIAASAFQQGSNHVIVRTRDAAGNVFSAAKENLQLLDANGGEQNYQLSLTSGSNGVRLADWHWQPGLVLPTQGSAVGQVFWVENTAWSNTTIQTQGTDLSTPLTLQYLSGSAAFQWDGSRWVYQGNTVKTFDFTLDTSVATPTLALAADTGASATDGLTNNGLISVGNLAAGATWQYSTNGGATWTAGSGNSFTLAEGSYAADAVQVRQTGAAGTTSPTTTLGAVQVDTTIAAVTLSLASDTGESNSDRITTNGLINVHGLEAGSPWEYSTDSGRSWHTGTGTSVPTSAFQAGANTLAVRTWDAAGNLYDPTIGEMRLITGVQPGATFQMGVDKDYSGTRAFLETPTAVRMPTAGLWKGQVYWVENNSPDSTTLLADNTNLASPITLTNSHQALNTAMFVWNGSTWDYQGGSVPALDFTLQAPTQLARIQSVTDDTEYTPVSVGADRSTDDSTLRVYGTTAGPISKDGSEVVAIYDGDTRLGNATLNAIGWGWNYTTPSLAPGVHDLKARVENPGLGLSTEFTASHHVNVIGLANIHVTDNVGPVQGDISVVGGLTDDSTPTISGSVGAALLAGEKVGIYDGGTHIGYAQVNGADWTFTAPELSRGYHALTVKVESANGTVLTETYQEEAFVIQIAVDSPLLSLAADTGSSASDGVTKNGQVNVSYLADGSTWQYSVNGGSTWQTGSGSSFTLAEGSYAAGAVRARQTSSTGEISSVFTMGAITVDQTIAAPKVGGSVGNRIGEISGDSLLVTGLETGASWQYSLDGGNHWLNGTGNSIAAPNDHADAVYNVMVRETDLAGNFFSAAPQYQTFSGQFGTYNASFTEGYTGIAVTDAGRASNIVLPTSGMAVGQSYWVTNQVTSQLGTAIAASGTDLPVTTLLPKGSTMEFVWSGSRWVHQDTLTNDLVSLPNATGNGFSYYQLAAPSGYSNGYSITDGHWQTGVKLPDHGTEVGQTLIIDHQASTVTYLKADHTNLSQDLNLLGNTVAFRWDGGQWQFDGPLNTRLMSVNGSAGGDVVLNNLNNLNYQGVKITNSSGVPNLILPAGGAWATETFFVKNESALDVTVKTDHTNLSTPLVVHAGAMATFSANQNGSTWAEQHIVI